MQKSYIERGKEMIMLRFNNVPKLIAQLIPKLSIIIIILFFAVFSYIGQRDLAIRGLFILGMPAIAASALIFFKPRLFDEIEFDQLRPYSINLKFLILIFIFLYTLSLILLVRSESRSFAYFFIIAMMGGIVIVELLSANIYSKKEIIIFIILVQIISILMNVILGYTLKFSAFIFTTDIIYHMSYIKSILDSGYISKNMGDYQYWPLFHVLIASGKLITGLNLEMSYFLLNSLSFSSTILYLYLLAKNVSNNVEVAVLAALIYIFIRPVSYEGMDVLTRTTAYILCLLILYLILRKDTDGRLVSIAIFLILPLVLMHQTTLVYFLGFLLLLYFIESILYRSHKIHLNYIILFATSFMAYWLYRLGPILEGWIQIIFETKEALGLDVDILKNSPYIIKILLNIDFMFIIFLVIIGVVSQLNWTEKRNGTRHLLSIASLLMLPFYIPYTADLIIAFLGYRLPLLVSPFIAFGIATGVWFIIRKCLADRHNRGLLTSLIILSLLFCFWSSCLEGRLTDADILPNILDKESRNHFSHSELASFDFCAFHKTNSTQIYSDYDSQRYLEGHLNLTCSSKLQDLIINSCFIFRIGEYISSEKLLFFIAGTTLRGFQGSDRLIAVFLDDFPMIKRIFREKLEIYNNGSVLIYET